MVYITVYKLNQACAFLRFACRMETGMTYKIIADSCCDLAENSKIKDKVVKIPLTLTVEDVDIIDDETFNQADFIKRVDESKNSPKSACPSPHAYMEAYEGDEEAVFVITLSSKLSGSYESASVAKRMYHEDNPESDKKIYVIDSKSASVGEANIAETVFSVMEETGDCEKAYEKAIEFREGQNTFFVLESLETLRKNGRLSNLSAIVASVLNIKPVMAGEDGMIGKLDQARGMDKALAKMVKYIIERTINPEKKVLAISHCNCKERALTLKDMIMKTIKFKDITIAETAGVSTMYANNGGIIVAV